MENAEVKHERTMLGTFYPTNRVIAAFPSPDSAEKAYRLLLGIGMEVNILPPEEALRFFTECRDETSQLGSLMTRLSRHLDNESSYLDDDIIRAKAGSGFLIVQCESDEDAARIRGIVEPFAPSAMHRYLQLGVESMV
jgi:hypothetical protein